MRSLLQPTLLPAVLFLFFTTPLLWAQESVYQDPTPMVQFENGVTISKGEFAFVYQKNNGGLDSARKADVADYREYLDLYIMFRRKVMAAEAAGLDTTKSFTRELEGYLAQLAQPYLTDREFLDKLVDEALLRSKQDINFSKIQINVGSNGDSVQAAQLANRLLDSLQNHGADFAELAERHSDDPFTSPYGGYASWASVFDLPYEIETELYNMEPGQLSEVVKYRDGQGTLSYNILKLNNVQDAVGAKTTAHILVRWGPSYVAQDSAEAVKRMQMIVDQLEAGESFEELAREYSDDPRSKVRGGDLGTVRLLPVMEDVKFRLDVGEVSQPFASPYGLHLLKVTDRAAPQTGQDARKQIRAQLMRNPRHTLATRRFLDSLKQHYNYQDYPETQQAMLEKLDTRYMMRLDPDTLDLPVLDKPLFTYDGGEVTGREMLAKLQTVRRNMQGKTTAQLFEEELLSMTSEILFKMAEAELPERYPEFARLKQEYRDGILLFTLTENQVWDKAVEDSAGLRAFYEAHKDSFPAPQRVRVTEFSATDTAALSRLRELLEAGLELEELDSVARKEQLRLRLYRRSYPRGESELADELYQHKDGYLSTRQKDGLRYYFVRIDKFFPAGHKTFEEARPEAITRYQNYLEQQWLQGLKQRYPIAEQNRDLLNTLYAE